MYVNLPHLGVPYFDVGYCNANFANVALSAYTNDRKIFHNRFHIVKMLNTLSSIRYGKIKTDFVLSKFDHLVLELSILFHDVIFDPRDLLESKKESILILKNALKEFESKFEVEPYTCDIDMPPLDEYLEDAVISTKDYDKKFNNKIHDCLHDLNLMWILTDPVEEVEQQVLTEYTMSGGYTREQVFSNFLAPFYVTVKKGEIFTSFLSCYNKQASKLIDGMVQTVNFH